MNSISRLGAKVREVRREQRLSAQKLAERAAIHANTLLALERGVGNTQLAQLLSVLDVLGLDLQLVPKAVARQVELDASTKATSLSDQISHLMGAAASPGGEEQP